MLDYLDKLDRLERQLARAFPDIAPPPTVQETPPDQPSRHIEGARLLDFVPRVTPRWERPDHLWKLAELFERARHEEIRALISVPPQHGKTELTLHGIAQDLSLCPENSWGYISYGADYAHSRSRLARDYAIAAGVELRSDSNAVDNWRTTSGGGLLATGIGGPLTGQGLQRLVIDDPHKNREEAESAIHRAKVRDFYTSTALTRVHPGGSVFVVHTRWHDDDLIGQLKEELEADGSPAWEVINLPAISEKGEALWERGRPLKWLEKRRASMGDYDWWSLYMGSPRPRGSGVFQEAYLYAPEDRPQGRLRVGIGADFAYSTKKRADYSVAVVMARVGEGDEAVFYILDVIRKQIEAPAFQRELESLNKQWSAPAVAFIGGTEKGIVDYMNEGRANLEALPATADKFIRAQPVAAAWNAGRVLVPMGAAWANDFISELRAFPTGRNDDQVDALSAAFHAVAQSAPLVPVAKTLAPSRWGNSSRGFG